MNCTLAELILDLSLAVALPALVLWSSALDRWRRWGLFAISTGWLILITTASAAGLFMRERPGISAAGAVVVLPFVLLYLFRRSPTLRTVRNSVPSERLVLLHLGRLIGVEFLILHAAGRLPATFAYSAGWGDVLTALLAVPVAALIARNSSKAQTAALLWNLLGTADLAAALALGVGSSSTFPLRFVFENPPTDGMGALPVFLIPGFLVPFYLLTHLLLFRQLAAGRPMTRIDDRNGQPERPIIGEGRIARENG